MKLLVKRVFLYGLCGGSGAALDAALYWILVAHGTHYQYANIVGYASGTLLSFILNRKITFQVKDATARRMAMFFGVAAVGYTASTLLLFILVRRLHLDPYVSKLISLVLVVLIQFTLNSLVTFRKRGWADAKSERQILRGS